MCYIFVLKNYFLWLTFITTPSSLMKPRKYSLVSTYRHRIIYVYSTLNVTTQYTYHLFIVYITYWVHLVQWINVRNRNVDHNKNIFSSSLTYYPEMHAWLNKTESSSTRRKNCTNDFRQNIVYTWNDDEENQCSPGLWINWI
jgi:hypothetical protein